MPAFCVLDFLLNQSVIYMQRNYRTKFDSGPPSGATIRKWYTDFKADSSQAVAISSVPTTVAASPKTRGQSATKKVCISMQTFIENDNEFIRSVVFSDEATFYLSVERRGEERRGEERRGEERRGEERRGEERRGEEKVEKFEYLGATVTNINDTQEEIKHRINMGNACYYSVEKLLSSSLLSKNLKVRIYKTVILPVVLYGCETWTLTLREEHRLRVFENEVLRKIFGAKRDEVTGEWRKLHNIELYAFYSSPDIIRKIKSRRLRWAGHVARMDESRNSYRVLVARPEGKRPLGWPRRRWEDNIKMDLREVGYDDRDWINLAQDRDQWRAYGRAAMNLRVS
ncbi:hypothetical protein ANN_24399 [Periplaneta americana]|uniref:DUF4817 domain-containing protein n=1 Tax=Periplaneta americana TaxID=6978 RepID=A0ABQ8S391_PERAM|nr:hypothetical protein ANN_24399 [Periplaneta americana]